MRIKLTSAGLVLFKQRCHGCNGKSIWIYKVGSMVVIRNMGTIYFGTIAAHATKNERQGDVANFLTQISGKIGTYPGGKQFCWTVPMPGQHLAAL